MTLYFLDSSAIVKRYFQEPGHEWIETLHDPAQGHGLYIAQAALVEVVAGICRKAREQNMPREERDSTINDFRRDIQNTYSVWVVMTRCTLLVVTCVARTNYERTMPSSWPVLWQCVRMFL